MLEELLHIYFTGFFPPNSPTYRSVDSSKAESTWPFFFFFKVIIIVF